MVKSRSVFNLKKSHRIQIDVPTLKLMDYMYIFLLFIQLFDLFTKFYNIFLSAFKIFASVSGNYCHLHNIFSC